MGAELPYQICEIGAIYRMWCNTQNTHLPCQSTPSLRKVTVTVILAVHVIWISIHTFLAEGDSPPCTSDISVSNFNPHLPCGRWPGLFAGDIIAQKFQSTPSLRKVTQNSNARAILDALFQSTPSLQKVTLPGSSRHDCKSISIHTFLAEGDLLRR